MKKALSLGLLACAGFSNLLAQEVAERATSCAEWKLEKQIHAKTTVADPAEDEYDIKYVKFNLSVTNMSTTISGDVTTVAKVVAPFMNAYVFELHNLFTIDSVRFNGVVRPVTTTGYVRTVTLTNPLPMNSTFTAQVFYNGNSGNTMAFQGHGIRKQKSPSWNS